MDWNDLRHFLALARTGSVRAAGASLGVSHSTVARRVDALETELSTRLFDRGPDGYVLTEAGEAMLPRAERIEEEAYAIERDLLGQDDRLEGPVSLTCTDGWVLGLVLEELQPFLLAHPEISLQASVDARNFDLSRREADIAIRATGRDQSPDEWLLGRRVVPIVMCSYVGEDHVERLDPERSDSEARWLGTDATAVQQLLISDSSYPELPVWGSIASMGGMVAGARAGLGLVMLPTYVGDQEQGLVRLRRPDLRHMGDFWLVSHPDLRDNRRLQVMRRQVAEALRRNEALFRGEAWCSPAPAGSDDAPQ